MFSQDANIHFDFDVFISYDGRDEAFVDWLTQIFSTVGLKFFRDTVNINIFERLDATLKHNISQSRWLIAVISESYLNSYWCLFEAMEAVQSQDQQLRFLPLSLRYTSGDAVLNEDFVLNAITELSAEIDRYELAIVRNKAYDLSSKLDKLQYVRSHLPKILGQIQERVYPHFDVWDKATFNASGGKLIRYLKPELADFAPPPFAAPEAPHSADKRPQRLNVLPTILWKQKVGHCAHRNTPLVIGNQLYIGAAGDRWNEPDANDGIACLDIDTGAQKWKVQTPADANSVLCTRGIVVTGCDDGTVVAFRSTDGKELWSVKFDTGIVGGPLKLTVNASRGDMSDLDPIAVVEYSGVVHLINIFDGSLLQEVDLGRRVLADMTMSTNSNRPMIVLGNRLYLGCVIFIVSADGVVFAIPFDEISKGGRLMAPIPFCNLPKLVGDEIKCTTPVLLNGATLHASYARNTTFDDPPMAALDLTTGRLKWKASDPGKVVRMFGNIRGNPIVLDGDILFTTAYSNALVGVSEAEGTVGWSVILGSRLFEQWSGPVTDGKEAVYIGRHDGYLHKISPKNRRREWSIYLGNADRAGFVVDGSQVSPEFSDTESWRAPGSAPILSTPTLDRGRVYVGTGEGWLYCIGNVEI